MRRIPCIPILFVRNGAREAEWITKLTRAYSGVLISFIALAAVLLPLACDLFGDNVLDAPSLNVSNGEYIGRIELSWDAVENADAYTIEWQVEGGDGYNWLVEIDTTEYTHYCAGYNNEFPSEGGYWDGRPMHGEQYSYRVQAIDWDEEYDASDWSTGTGATKTLPAPENLSIDTLNMYEDSMEVTLSWDSADDAQSYTLTYGYKMIPIAIEFETETEWDTYASENTEDSSVTLSLGTSTYPLDQYIWTFIVQSKYSFSGEGGSQAEYFSDGSNIVTSSDSGISGFGAPQNLSGEAGTNSLALSWDEVQGADSYLIQRSENSAQSYSELAGGIEETGYTDDTVQAGVTYLYRVQAKSGYDYSPWSEVLTIEYNPVSGWILVGEAGFASANGEVNIASADDAVYVAFEDATDTDERVAVMHYDTSGTSGTSWQNLGYLSDGTSEDDRADVAVNDSGIPYIAFEDTAHVSGGTPGCFVKSYDGSAWQAVGSTDGVSYEDPDSGDEVYCFGSEISVVTNEGIPYVMYATDSGELARGLTYNDSTGTVWELLEKDFLDFTTFGQEMRFGTDGTLYACVDVSDLTVYSFDGNTWTKAGDTIEQSADAAMLESFSFCLNASDKPCVAYSEYVSGSSGYYVRVFVQCLEPSGWEDLELAETTSVDYGPISLASFGNVLYAAFADKNDSDPRIIIRGYESGAWSTVGGGYYDVDESIDNIELVFEANGTAYIAYGTSSSGNAPYSISVITYILP